MRVIEGGEVVSSGDGGGRTCHNDKPGQSKDKVLKVESRRVEVRGELEGGSGGTLLVVLQLAWLLHPPMVDSRSTSPSLTLMTSSGTLRLSASGAF